MTQTRLLAMMLASAGLGEIKSVMNDIMVAGFNMDITVQRKENELEIYVNDEYAAKAIYQIKGDLILYGGVGVANSWSASVNFTVYSLRSITCMMEGIAYDEMKKIANEEGKKMEFTFANIRYEAMVKATEEFLTSQFRNLNLDREVA